MVEISMVETLIMTYAPLLVTVIGIIVAFLKMIKIMRELKADNKLSNEEKPCIYPLDVFCAMNWRTHQVYRTEHTVSIHHYKASWKNNKKDMLLIARIEDKICRTIRLRNHFVLSRLYKKFLHLVINDKEYSI